MFRRKVSNRRADRRFFRHTADKVNSINVFDVQPRGGTRM